MNVATPLEQLSQPSIATTLAYIGIAVYAVHILLVHGLDLDVPSPPVLVWHALVSILPSSLLLDPTVIKSVDATASRSEIYAAKSDALHAMLGLGAISSKGATLLSKLPAATDVIGVSNIVRRNSVSSPQPPTSDVPAGLGNWDNSCYQNSVLQALSSLSSLRIWLETARNKDVKDAQTTTTSALADLMRQLRDPSNNGKHIWTPAKLKSMSSWQQQDAQEYFSKIMDELDNEAKKAAKLRAFKAGLETLNRAHDKSDMFEKEAPDTAQTEISQDHNPLEGWVAQRVACTQCGGSDGFSMIPFNCLTVPLGNLSRYSLEQCLDEYTKREDIEGVECRRCTLLQTQAKLRRMLPQPVGTRHDSVAADASAESVVALPSDLMAQISKRLQAIDDALSRDDYSDKTLKQECQISEKAYVNSTKTREAVIGRAPRALAVHINRSVFNEMTGSLSKNHARVQYPYELDLRPWMFNTGHNPVRYTLSAAVIHKGAHENGHYICYRQHPRALGNTAAEQTTKHDITGPPEGDWYQLSDADVYESSEADALSPRAGGVFMLFYERNEDDAYLKRTNFENDRAVAALTPLPPDNDDDSLAYGMVLRDADAAAADDDDTTTTGSQPPTVPPSEVSEADTELTDYDSPEPAIETDAMKAGDALLG